LSPLSLPKKAVISTLPGFYGRKLLIGALRFQRAAYLRRAAYRAANTVGLKFVWRQMAVKISVAIHDNRGIGGELVARRRVAELALIRAKRTPFAKTILPPVSGKLVPDRIRIRFAAI
jgi:hypothetical protein